MLHRYGAAACPSLTSLPLARPAQPALITQYAFSPPQGVAMRSSLILPLCLVFAGLVGCGAQKGPATVPVTSTPTKNAPSWIDNEEIPDGLAAVGIAQPNPMGD